MLHTVEQWKIPPRPFGPESTETEPLLPALIRFRIVPIGREPAVPSPPEPHSARWPPQWVRRGRFPSA